MSHGVGEGGVAGERVPDHHQAVGLAAQLEVVGGVAVARDGVGDDVEGSLEHRVIPREAHGIPRDG